MLLSVPVTVLGMFLRIMAFATARSNFHHLIRYRREQGHKLVTHGVYSFERHPGYMGYFYFSIASQLILGNFVSFLAFFYVLWNFFYDRICEEEETLIVFFGKEYMDY